MNLCHPNTIKELMADAGIVFRKDYGQNFLINPMVPADIADNCAKSADTMILEVGPGIGCLTAELAERYARVVAVEIDKGLIPVLDKTLSEYDNVTVINGDIMQTNLKELIDRYSEGREVAVAANLPYYITTPILMRLLECGVPFSSITVMVQNEVASRLSAKAGSGEYGAITAVLGYYGTVTRLFKVPAGCFMPAPKVDSAVIRIDLFLEKPYRPKDETLFFSLIHGAFEMRRKTLANALSSKLSGYTKEEITDAVVSLGFDPNIRGEKLSTADYARLCDVLFDIKMK